MSELISLKYVLQAIKRTEYSEVDATNRLWNFWLTYGEYRSEIGEFFNAAWVGGEKRGVLSQSDSA